jgi:DNA-directed RNA polymerase specialized sigma24 family protein
MMYVEIDPLLLPFLRATGEAEAQLQLERLISLATPMIKKVVSRSHHPEDAFQETAQRLIEKLRAFKLDSGDKAISNYFHYVNVIASHVAKGQLRERRRGRRSLVDALRYALKGSLQFDVWEDVNQEKLCGLAAWRRQAVNVTRSPRLSQLLDHPDAFGEVVPTTRNIRSMDYAEMLAEIFRWVDHPIKYDDLVKIVCDMRLVENFVPIAEADGDEQGRPLSERLVDAAPRPDEVAEWNEFLERLWGEIVQLPRLQRMAYLLNFTSGDGQLELFWNHGVVGIPGIGAALQLTEDQFITIWSELGLSGEERRRVEAAAGYDEKFALLWMYLPLTDGIIAKIIGAERQKVINLRKAASDRLSRRLADRGRSGQNLSRGGNIRSLSAS